MNKMLDHITDGPSEPQDVFNVPAEDLELWEALDDEMQRRLDEGLCRWCGKRPVSDPDGPCEACRIEAAAMTEFR